MLRTETESLLTLLNFFWLDHEESSRELQEISKGKRTTIRNVIVGGYLEALTQILSILNPLKDIKQMILADCVSAKREQVFREYAASRRWEVTKKSVGV